MWWRKGAATWVLEDGSFGCVPTGSCPLQNSLILSRGHDPLVVGELQGGHGLLVVGELQGGFQSCSVLTALGLLAPQGASCLTPGAPVLG